MANKTMKTLTYGDITYEITDDYARSRVDFLDTGVKGQVPTTLLASGWVGEESPYTYSITIDDHNNTTDIINLLIGDEATVDQVKEIQEANIIRAEWDDEVTLVLYAYGDKPEDDIPIKIYINSPLSEAYDDEEVMLLASGWVGYKAPYTYHVTIDGHKNTTDAVNIMVGDNMTTEQVMALQAANIIQAKWENETTLVLYAYGTKPTVDAPVKIYANPAFTMFDDKGLEDFGINVLASEINCLAGVTGNIQEQLNNLCTKEEVNAAIQTAILGAIGGSY